MNNFFHTNSRQFFPGFSSLFYQQPPSNMQSYPSESIDSGPPQTPPPTFIPEQQQLQTFAMDPGAIRGCLFRFTYIWLPRDGFWFFPVFIGRRSISGYRWVGFRWVYAGIDLNHIQSFQCY